MNSKKHNTINERTSITKSFLALASRKLTSKEKQALVFLSSRKVCKNATQTVNELSHALQCAESTVWAIIRSLKSSQLITYEGDNSILILSVSGKLLLEEKLE